MNRKLIVAVVGVAGLFAGCASGLDTHTEIRDVTVTVPIPPRVDSARVEFVPAPFVIPAHADTSILPIFRAEMDRWAVEWRPTPKLPDAVSDTLRAIRRQFQRTLLQLQAVQGDLGEILVRQKADSAQARLRDTTQTTKPPDIIEFPFWSKAGLAVVSAFIGILLFVVFQYRPWERWRKGIGT